MAIPSGSGTEVLNRTTIHALNTTATSFRWDGTNATTGTATYAVPANHIITVINIVFAENAAAVNEYIQLYVNDGSNDIFLSSGIHLPKARDVFIWNDRIVLRPADKLIVDSASSAMDIDCYCSFIDQDWS